MTNKLIDEYPLLVLPTLAKAIGLNEAIILQQVHYWLTTFRVTGNSDHFRDGRWWVYNTYEEWMKNFPWWSRSTIKRTLLSLKERGLLLATDKYNRAAYDRTLWYTIDYDALDSLGPDCPEPSVQNEPMERASVAPPIPETNTKTTKELPPIGGGVVVHDLDEVAYYLEHTGRRKGDLEAQCPHCGAGHTQEINVCPDCQAHVVWLNSPAWKKRFGNPKVYLQEIEGQDLKAVGPLEVEFCRTFNYGTKFANQTQQKQFRALARKYPADYIRELMTWANGKGFQALKGAAENPDNLTRWKNKQYEETQPGADNDQPSGWELQALQAMERK